MRCWKDQSGNENHAVVGSNNASQFIEGKKGEEDYVKFSNSFLRSSNVNISREKVKDAIVVIVFKPQNSNLKKIAVWGTDNFG